MTWYFLTARPRGGPWAPVGLYRLENQAVQEAWRQRGQGKRVYIQEVPYRDRRIG